MDRYTTRFYRNWIRSRGYATWRTAISSSDLLISCDADLRGVAEETLRSLRNDIQSWIAVDRRFLESLEPVGVPDDAPRVVRTMADAAGPWGVGPMAAVAGAIAEEVGRALLDRSATEVIVENGGDIFALSRDTVRFALYAGEDSPFSNRFAFELHAPSGVGVCTSSGRVGPSLSLGNADAVVAIAPGGATADAAATAVANAISEPSDVSPVIERLHRKGGLGGLIACAGGSIGFFGAFRLILRGEEEGTCLLRA